MRRIPTALLISTLIILALTVVHPILAKSLRPRVPILLFHHIDQQLGKWHVSPRRFEQDLAYLSKAGYHTISLDTYMDALQKGAALPDKPIILTFDDGYRDNYDNAFPLLKKYGMTGTFYIVTGRVGNKNFVTWDDLTAMHNAGMEIGAHTVDHPFLTRLPPLTAFGEIWLSKLALEVHLGIPIHTF